MRRRDPPPVQSTEVRAVASGLPYGRDGGASQLAYVEYASVSTLRHRHTGTQARRHTQTNTHTNTQTNTHTNTHANTHAYTLVILAAKGLI